METTESADFLPRYITFGYRQKVHDIWEWTALNSTGNLYRGIYRSRVEDLHVGRMLKARSLFSYQVFRGLIIVTGGVSSNGDILRSTEIIDCNAPRETLLHISSNKVHFPFLKRKRH